MLTLRSTSDTNTDVLPQKAGVTQLVESLPSKQMVAGSNPVARSNLQVSDVLLTLLNKG